MLAFTNTRFTKQQMLDQVRSQSMQRPWHRPTLAPLPATDYPEYAGIPLAIAYLVNNLHDPLRISGCYAEYFEWMPRAIEAIPIGADLSLVAPRFAWALLTEHDSPFSGIAREYEPLHTAIESLAGNYAEWFRSGIEPEASKWTTQQHAIVTLLQCEMAVVPNNSRQEAIINALNIACSAAHGSRHLGTLHLYIDINTEKGQHLKWACNTLIRLLQAAPVPSSTAR